MPTVFDAHTNPSSQPVSTTVRPTASSPHTHGAHSKPYSKYFHAFCLRPNLTFGTQHKDEQILLLLRAHPITQIPWIVASVVLFLTPFVVIFFVQAFLNSAQTVFAGIVWYSFLFSYIFINILNYIFNVGLITNHRVVDIDYHYVLYREVNQTTFNQIQDVTTKTGGFIRTVLHYGDIFIQTAGTEANIEFHAIPEPTQAATIINSIISGQGQGFI